MNKQHGFLSLAGVVIIIIFGLLSAYLASMFIRSSTSSTYISSSKQQASLAETGLEVGLANLTLANIGTGSTNRSSCAGLSVPITSLSTGAYTVYSANNFQPYFVSNTLNTTIPASGTVSTITLNSASSFAPFGRVLIGREVFLYTGVSGSTLTGVQRAQDNTTATLHTGGSSTTGAIVSQYQCTLEANAAGPDASSPYARRLSRQDVQQPMLIGVGVTHANAWNPSTAELGWADMGLPTTTNTNGVDALNYHDAWAVGDKVSGGTKYFVRRLQGTTWTQSVITAPGTGTRQQAKAQNLNAVYATSGEEAWAVGNAASGAVIATASQLNILHWLRSTNTWCVVPLSGTTCDSKLISETGVNTGNNTPSLFAVKTVDTTGSGLASIGYAAGGKTNSYSFIMQYNGTTWSLLSSPALPANSGQINGLDFPLNGASNPKEVYFVGQTTTNNVSRIIKYNVTAGTMSLIGNGTTTQNMNAVSVIDTNGDGLADFGCAVGNNGIYTFFNSSSFTASYRQIAAGATLNAVKVLSTSDVWAFGFNSAGNAVGYHYNGTSWNLVGTVPNAATSDFSGMTAIFPRTPSSYWYDVIQ